jgi:hypothetical protein
MTSPVVLSRPTAVISNYLANIGVTGCAGTNYVWKSHQVPGSLSKLAIPTFIPIWAKIGIAFIVSAWSLAY